MFHFKVMMVFVHALKPQVTLTTNANGKVSLCQQIMLSTHTRKLIYYLQEAHFTLSLVMTVAHEYYATFFTKQHILTRVCQSVDTAQFLKIMSSHDESCRPLGRKQCSVRGPKTRCRALGMFRKATSKETSSPEVAPTATGKKLALPKPHFSSMDIAVSPLVTDGASFLIQFVRLMV